MPLKSSVVDGGNPVSSGTRNVAPNIATTCCTPRPIVRPQVRRSSGATIVVAETVAPSPCSFHGSPMRRPYRQVSTGDGTTGAHD